MLKTTSEPDRIHVTVILNTDQFQRIQAILPPNLCVKDFIENLVDEALNHLGQQGPEEEPGNELSPGHAVVLKMQRDKLQHSPGVLAATDKLIQEIIRMINAQ